MSIFHYEDPQYVQLFLDNLEPMQTFKVIFVTQKEEQRAYVGTLDPDKPSTRNNSVAILTDDGWKRFSLDRVLWVGIV